MAQFMIVIREITKPYWKSFGGRRPPQILIGGGLMILASLFTIGQMLVDFSSWPTTLVQVANIDGIDINCREYYVVNDGWLECAVGCGGNRIGWAAASRK